MRTNYSIILLFFILSLSCFCQHKVKGVILDSLTKKPVAFPVLSFENKPIGKLGLEDGTFELSIPDSLLNIPIRVSCVGYVDEKFLSGKHDSFVIILNPKHILLPEVVVDAAPKLVSVGSTRKKCQGHLLGQKVHQRALYMSAPSLPAIIKSVRFYVTNEGVPRSKFRVNIYEANLDSSPGRLLLDTNLITQAKRGNAWVVVDILRFRIHVPVRGFLVSMEWLPDEKEYIHKYSLEVNGRSYRKKETLRGQALGFSHEFSDVNLSWFKSVGGAWHPDFSNLAILGKLLDVCVGCDYEKLKEIGVVSPMIGADLLVY